jgi:minor extracellular serine protease Vpr
VPLPVGGTFTLVGNDLPFILLHLNHQVTNLKVEVFDVATGQSLNLAEDDDFVQRNSAPNSFFPLAWDGTTFRKPGHKVKGVPNGTYRLELSVLKALGNPNNPDHFERWTSPNITIARP